MAVLGLWAYVVILSISLTLEVTSDIALKHDNVLNKASFSWISLTNSDSHRGLESWLRVWILEISKWRIYWWFPTCLLAYLVTIELRKPCSGTCVIHYMLVIVYRRRLVIESTEIVVLMFLIHLRYSQVCLRMINRWSLWIHSNLSTLLSLINSLHILKSNCVIKFLICLILHLYFSYILSITFFIL